MSDDLTKTVVELLRDLNAKMDANNKETSTIRVEVTQSHGKIDVINERLKHGERRMSDMESSIKEQKEEVKNHKHTCMISSRCNSKNERNEKEEKEVLPKIIIPAKFKQAVIYAFLVLIGLLLTFLARVVETHAK